MDDHATAGSLVDHLVVVGANHRSSSLTLRDALAVEDAMLPVLLETLRERGFGQCLLLSTCDRCEVIAVVDDPSAAMARAVEFFQERLAVAAQQAAQQGEAEALPLPAAFAGGGAEALRGTLLRGQLYTLRQREALQHVFAVTSALDSLMIGEPHILGQVKTALRASRDAAVSGGGLEAVIQAAFAVAKKVRSQTAIGEGPVSVAACAAQVARDVFGDLSRTRLLVVGGGDMGLLVCEHLMAQGSRPVAVTARRAGRAEQLQRTLGGHIIPFEGLAQALSEAEIIVCGLSGRTWAMTEDAVRAALKRRRQKPILVIDAAIPGDVEPAVNRVDNAFLYDLNDLERLAEKGRSQREAAAQQAWAIVEADVEAFVQQCAQRPAVPAIAALRQRFEAERAKALAEASGDAEKATRLLIGRLLHPPSEMMRHLAAADQGNDRWRHAEAMIRQLFQLEP